MYDFPITTTASTTKAAPKRTLLRLRPGVITLVHVSFPPGPQGLLHVVLERGGSLLWPENEGDGFATDNYTIVFTPYLELSTGRDHLTAVTWNDDDTFSHQVNIRLQVTDPAIATPDRPELGLLQQLTRRLIGSRA